MFGTKSSPPYFVQIQFRFGVLFVVKDVLDKIHVCVLWRFRYGSGEYFEPFPIHVTVECAARFVHQGVSSFFIPCCDAVDALIRWLVLVHGLVVWVEEHNQSAIRQVFLTFRDHWVCFGECHVLAFLICLDACQYGRVDVC